MGGAPSAGRGRRLWGGECRACVGISIRGTTRRPFSMDRPIARLASMRARRRGVADTVPRPRHRGIHAISRCVSGFGPGYRKEASASLKPSDQYVWSPMKSALLQLLIFAISFTIASISDLARRGKRERTILSMICVHSAAEYEVVHIFAAKSDPVFTRARPLLRSCNGCPWSR